MSSCPGVQVIIHGPECHGSYSLRVHVNNALVRAIMWGFPYVLVLLLLFLQGREAPLEHTSSEGNACQTCFPALMAHRSLLCCARAPSSHKFVFIARSYMQILAWLCLRNRII